MIEPITFGQATHVPKGWGSETHLVNNGVYCGKILRFNKGKSFSMHSHDLKTETWYITMGHLILTYFDLTNADKITRQLNPGDVIHIPRGNPHQLEALDDSELIEVSTPDYASDSYRIGKGASQQ